MSRMISPNMMPIMTVSGGNGVAAKGTNTVGPAGFDMLLQGAAALSPDAVAVTPDAAIPTVAALSFDSELHTHIQGTEASPASVPAVLPWVAAGLDMPTETPGRTALSPLPVAGAKRDHLNTGMAGETGPQDLPVAMPEPVAPAEPARAVPMKGGVQDMFLDPTLSKSLLQRGVAHAATTKPIGLTAWADMPAMLARDAQAGRDTLAKAETAERSTATPDEGDTTPDADRDAAAMVAQAPMLSVDSAQPVAVAVPFVAVPMPTPVTAAPQQGEAVPVSGTSDPVAMQNRARIGIMSGAAASILPFPMPAVADMAGAQTIVQTAGPIMADPARVAPNAAQPKAGSAGEALALLGMIAGGARGLSAAGADAGSGQGATGDGSAKHRALDMPVTVAEVSVDSPVASLPMPQAAAPVVGLSGSPIVAQASDVGATLGQQVIDMGSSGQWIDGLAREIATLSAGSGQGSFRLSPEHLGPMRVDVRTGDAGTTVTLTVETKAAESALVKDKGALQADAQLSDLRIADVKVERVALIAEPGKSDGAAAGNGQNPQQTQHQTLAHQGFAQGQMTGQGAGAGQNGAQAQQGRKLLNDDAVSKGVEPGDRRESSARDDVRRARYA